MKTNNIVDKDSDFVYIISTPKTRREIMSTVEQVESAQHIHQQTKAKITCCFCGSSCVRIRGESEWVKCSKCGELHRK
jgi:ribosomal protein L37AE/L43A